MSRILPGIYKSLLTFIHSPDCFLTIGGIFPVVRPRPEPFRHVRYLWTEVWARCALFRGRPPTRHLLFELCFRLASLGRSLSLVSLPRRLPEPPVDSVPNECGVLVTGVSVSSVRKVRKGVQMEPDSSSSTSLVSVSAHLVSSFDTCTLRLSRNSSVSYGALLGSYSLFQRSPGLGHPAGRRGFPAPR